jgi:GTP 3',8-cyclase
MPPAVFDALTAQLAELNFGGRISYHFYNEPLLRKDLDRLVSTVDERVPHALQVLYTNGDLLSDHKYRQLRAAGIDYFIVTRHSGGSFPERPFQVVQRSQDLVLTNRGGVLAELPPASAAVRRQPCFVASEMLIVTVTGDVVLCYEDSRREHVLGNVLEQHVADIWQQPRATELRQALARGERSILPMCSQCSNAAHTRPGLSQVEEPFLNDQTTARLAPIVELKRRSAQERRRQARTR